MLTAHHHLVPMLRMSGAIRFPPIRLHGVDRDSFTFRFYLFYQWAVWCSAGFKTCWQSQPSVQPCLRFEISATILRLLSDNSVNFFHPVHKIIFTHSFRLATRPKRVLHTVLSSASSFHNQYLLLSWSSFSSCLRLLPCISYTSIFVFYYFFQ
jgi:hypothetical protein